MSKEIKIKADNYKEFAEKVKDLVQLSEGGSLAFLKAVGMNAVYKDRYGNRIYYAWEKIDEDLSDER